MIDVAIETVMGPVGTALPALVSFDGETMLVPPFTPSVIHRRPPPTIELASGDGTGRSPLGSFPMSRSGFAGRLVPANRRLHVTESLDWR